jgi:hypothetical protein
VSRLCTPCVDDRIARLVPSQAQRQDALADQLRDVWYAAVRLGCYDAADWIMRGTISRFHDKPQALLLASHTEPVSE